MCDSALSFSAEKNIKTVNVAAAIAQLLVTMDIRTDKEVKK